MKKYLVITNHAFMLWQFRRELIGKLLEQGCDVIVSAPLGDHFEDFRALGCRMADIPVDRRGLNPFRNLKLCLAYRKLLAEEKPDMVITYSIKPNIYAGFLCRLMKEKGIDELFSAVRRLKDERLCVPTGSCRFLRG